MMDKQKGSTEYKSKKIRIDKNGMHFRLFIIFMVIIIAIVGAIGIAQYIFTKNQVRHETIDQLEEVSANISATYGTDAYEGAIRSVLATGNYRVRVIQDNGTTLIDPSKYSVDLSWPDFTDDNDIAEKLNRSPGYYTEKIRDDDNVLWIVRVQLLAVRDGQKEILIVTRDTLGETAKLNRLLVLYFSILVIILIIIFIVCWFVTKNYLKPIEVMTERARQLAEGDYSVKFPHGEYSELNLLSDTLDLATEQMANYEQNRRDMIANVSHDMRTPLTMIKAYAEMIKNITGDNPEKRDQNLDVIISQADQLSEFVTSTMYLSQLQSGSKPLKIVRFSLDETIRAYVNRIKQLDEDDHEYKLKLEYDCFVNADPGRIERLVSNLVDNSKKYGGKITALTVKRIENTVHLEVADFGEGIPKEKLRLIWEKYYQVNPYGHDNSNAGVGLSIVKEIAELHHLEYGVESDVGEGVRFWFIFPYAKEEL